MGKRSTGGIAVAIAIMAVAQRLANYGNKPLALALAVGAGIFLLWFAVLWAKDMGSRLIWDRRRVGGCWSGRRTVYVGAVSVLAGGLYSVSAEIGEDNNGPESDDIPIILTATEKDKAAEELLRLLPVPAYAGDHRVMKRIAEMRFDDRL